jgi:hypothetical protein
LASINANLKNLAGNSNFAAINELKATLDQVKTSQKIIAEAFGDLLQVFDLLLFISFSAYLFIFFSSALLIISQIGCSN